MPSKLDIDLTLTTAERAFLVHILDRWSPPEGPHKITKKEQRITDALLAKLQ